MAPINDLMAGLIIAPKRFMIVYEDIIARFTPDRRFIIGVDFGGREMGDAGRRFDRL